MSAETWEHQPHQRPSPPSDTLRTIRRIALAIGIVLFCATLYFIDLPETLSQVRRLGLALPGALVFSGLWHLARTWAWAWCFPQPRTVRFATLARVRIAAEAFSYLTLRGVAGEPLKVVLLSNEVDPRQATAAVALERIAYTVATTLIVGLCSAVAIAFVPMTRIWFRVFRAFAIFAAVVAILAAVAIAGHGTYLQSLMRAMDRRTGLSMASGRVGRFIASVERLMLELVRTNPKRLAVLSLATAASFMFMVLEAWVILRAAGTPIGFASAIAVETFSRVASFASFLIPANLGALEASSVAALAAVGMTGGGALAIARRIRGLFWAGIGLALYPRHSRGQARTDDGDGPSGGRPRRTLLYLPYAADVAVPPSTRLAGLPIGERVVRSAFRAGYSRVIVLQLENSESDGAELRRLDGILRAVQGEITVVKRVDDWPLTVGALPKDEALTLIGPGTVTSPALLTDALSITPADEQPVSVPAGAQWPESGVLRVTQACALDLTTLESHLRALRARSIPLPSDEDVLHCRARLAVRTTTRAELTEAEWIFRRSSYKDTDAVVASFNRRMSLPISIMLMRTPITANQLSLLLVAMGLYAGWLFSLGGYWTGVLAAFLSLAAGVLDGCDGEIARLKYQESRLGCWIETFGDYSYYIAIFIGLTAGAVRQTGHQVFYWFGGLALCGTLLSFALLIYLRRRITAGQPERLHAIARDRFAAESSWWSALLWRLNLVATRAAMPYGIMAFALLNALPAIVVLAAIGANVYWVSLLVKMTDLMGQGQVSLNKRADV